MSLREEDVLAERTNTALDYLQAYNGTFGFLVDLKRKVFDEGRLLSERQVQAVLNCKARDDRGVRAVGERRSEPAEEGMYRREDGTIYKVQKAVHGSGRLYAKRLIEPNEYGARARFEYAPGMVYQLTAEEKMTRDEARAFGALYGTCCVCGRTLTDETSIAHGIGPVCEGRMGWRE